MRITFIALMLFGLLGSSQLAQAAKTSICPSIYLTCMGDCGPPEGVGGSACKALCDRKLKSCRAKEKTIGYPLPPPPPRPQ